MHLLWRYAVLSAVTPGAAALAVWLWSGESTATIAGAASALASSVLGAALAARPLSGEGRAAPAPEPQRREPSEPEAGGSLGPLLEHAASTVGIGHAEIYGDGRLGRITTALERSISRWRAPEAWWAAVRGTGVLPPASTCGRCGRPEWRYTRVVELTEPRGQRRVFELSATGHPGTCRADEAEAVNVLQVTDVTVRVDRELLLAAARDEAVIVGQAGYGALAGSIRELRTPLEAVLAFAETLRASGDPTSVGIERLLAAGQHVMTVLGRQCDPLARILHPSSSSLLKVEDRTFGVAALVHDLQPLARQLAHLGRNRLELRMGEELGVMVSDAVKVRQVLLSLVSNASRSTQDGEITLAVWRESGRIVFVVADDGEGIDPEALELVYEDFWSRGDPAWGRTDQLVGLAIARRLARLLGGDLTVRSRKDEGSTIMATLPADVPWSLRVGSPAPAERT